MNFSRAILCLFVTALVAGAETDIEIHGLRDQSSRQVLGLMGGRLEHVREGEATAARADDAAFLTRQILQKDGYADVRVTGQVMNRSKIVLTVSEGPRLSLNQVAISGVPDELNGKLVKLYSRPAEKDRPLAQGNPPFREEDVETGLSYIRQELNAQGYWDAEAEITRRETDTATGHVDVDISVRMGRAFTIGTPTVASSDSRGLVRTKTTVEPYIGKPATTGNLNAMRAAVDEAFLSRGYPDARITMGRLLAEATFVPEFTIDLGTRVRLNQVHTEGLVITNPERVKSRMRPLEGDWYNEAAMNKRIRGLLATGAFSSVRVETYPVAEKRIDATLHLEEGKAREMSFAAGADSYFGPLFRASYADRNLWGQLLGFSSGFEISAKGLLGEVKITDPWLFGNDVSGTLRAYALSYSREGYDSLESGLDAVLAWKAGDHYSMDMLVGTSVVNLSGAGLPSRELGETLYAHQKFRFTQRLDFRDSPVLPKSGWHLESPIEIGAAVGTESSAYVSTSIQGGWYHKLSPKNEVALGGEFGVLIPTGDGTDLPIDLRYFNGGSSSVRSFPNRELGPSVNGYPTGGEASWSANAEYLRTLAGSVKGVLFFDAGGLSRDYVDIGSAKLNLAAGLGVRLDLPIGPVRLEYGYNLTQDRGEPDGTLHFAIGATF